MQSRFLKNIVFTAIQKQKLEAEFIEARHKKMGVFLENLENFLNSLAMTEYAADVFEEVLLEMAGVKTKPKNCQLGPVDESILYIRIQGMDENEVKLFLSFLKNFDPLAKTHFVTEPTFKHFPQELLNAYSFEISKKAVVEKVFPQFIKTVEDWHKNFPEKLKGYVEKSKNHPNLPKLSSFILNPHRHVKIWFHLDIDESNFINLESKLRLIKFRKDNPKDEINFVFSKNLLSSKALANLLNFCKKYNMTPLSVEEDITKEVKEYSDKTLLKLLNMELEAAKNKKGGCLAAASDIARWLSPIYSRGIYSDFDVEVNTKNLPMSMMVKKPFLANYGSEMIDEDERSLLCSSEVLAIPKINPTLSQDEQAIAKKQQSDIIQKVLTWIVNCYQYTIKHFNEYLKLNLRQIEERVGNREIAKKILFSSEQFQRLYEMATGVYGNNLIAIRAGLDEKYSSSFQFAADKIYSEHSWARHFVLKYGTNPQQLVTDPKKQQLLTEFFAENTLTLVPTEFFDIYKKQGAKRYVQCLMENEHTEKYKKLVINTTGAGLLLNILGSPYFSASETKEKLEPYALSSYGLDKNFIGKVKINFNSVPKPIKMGEGDDIYWTTLGKAKVVEREEIIQKTAAIKIQKHWRLFKSKPTAPIILNNNNNEAHLKQKY